MAIQIAEFPPEKRDVASPRLHFPHELYALRMLSQFSDHTQLMKMPVAGMARAR